MAASGTIGYTARVSETAHAYIGTAIVAGAIAYAGLHLFAPPLAITWSFAHLDLHPAIRSASFASLLVLPLVAFAVGRLPIATRAVPALSRRAALGLVLGLSLLFLAVGWVFPSRAISLDASRFAVEVWKGWPGTARWYLTIVGFSSLLRVAEWVSPIPIPARDLVPVVNAGLSGLAYALLLGCARRLGNDAFEVGIVTLLAWTAFGNLQLALYYVDIYPVVQCAFALFLWLALRNLAGEGSLVGPVAVAALGPFFYVGLVLLWPAVAILIGAALRRPKGTREVAVAGGIALLLAGCATVPGFGHPFAFGPYLASLAEDDTRHLGLAAGSNLLPIGHLFSATHLREYLHTLLLIDGPGILLCATAGLPLLALAARGKLATPAGLLWTTTAAVLGYAFVMDPLWGAYADWDLFSYAAVPTSLLGGYAFVRWGREAPGARALIFGLLLAGASMHLAARLNALEVERERHAAESPHHLRAAGAEAENDLPYAP